jgi:hypothetical protein
VVSRLPLLPILENYVAVPGKMEENPRSSGQLAARETGTGNIEDSKVNKHSFPKPDLPSMLQVT